MTPAADDRTLMERIAAGDAEALHALYATYHARPWRYLWHALAGDAALVEEVVQDVFVAVWRAAATYRGTAQVATWLLQIAHHRATNARRDRDRRAALLDNDAEAADDLAVSVMLEDSVIARLALADALRHLAPHHQAVLHLFFYQGFSLQEIAQILGVPVGTVKSRISAARRAFAGVLAAEEAGEHEG
jgi:RNA polymerase sigma-70 factor (ECF subfamily)